MTLTYSITETEIKNSAKSQGVITYAGNPIMVSTDQVGTFITYENVYPHEPNDYSEFRLLLSKLSRTDALLWCARLNNIIAGPIDLNEEILKRMSSQIMRFQNTWPKSRLAHMERQAFGIRQFFSTEKQLLLAQILSKSDDPMKVMVFFRGQLLELFRWIASLCQDHEDDGRTFEDEATRIVFGKVALMSSEIWQKRVLGDRLKSEGDMNKNRRNALGAIYKSSQGVLIAENMERTLGRGWLIFTKYFDNEKSEYNRVYCDATGLNICEYFFCLAVYIVNIYVPKKENETNQIYSLFSHGDYAYFKNNSETMRAFDECYSLPSNESKLILCQGRKFGSDDYENPPRYEESKLRSKPILHSSGGVGVVIDPVFFNELAFSGILFGFPPDKRTHAIRRYGNAIELYVRSILIEMYGEPDNGRFGRVAFNETISQNNKIVAEIDALVRYPNEIFLFEVKSVFLSEIEILSEIDGRFADCLDRAYVYNKEESKYKGVLQLARSIEFLTMIDSDHSHDLDGVERVVPVLVVRDDSLSAPAISNYLALKFMEYFEKTFSERCFVLNERFAIETVVILTISDLENLVSVTKTEALNIIINDYCLDCPDRMISFTNYLSDPNNSDKLRHNSTLATAAVELLELTEEYFYK